MNFMEFRDQILEEMSHRLEGVEAEKNHVDKLQGQSYDGISFKRQDSNVAVTLNLDAYYKEAQDGRSMDSICDHLEEVIEDALNNMPDVDISRFSDYEKMKDTLTLQLVSTNEGAVKLSEIPHRKVEDMALVYRFEVDRVKDGIGSILVTNQLLDNYGITEEQLHQDAVEAAQKNRPASLRSMRDVMAEILSVPDMTPPIWVGSVEGGINGAAVMQYPDFLDQAVETIGGDFYVLPSSIHEILLVPDDGSMELDALEAMVRDVNATAVAPEDRLSDQVFHYDSEAHVFETARDFEAREANILEGKAIRVLLVEPGEYPKIVEVGKELEDLQSMVGGNIEVTYPFTEDVCLIMNEEGKLEGLPLNRGMTDEQGKVYDVIAGPFMVAGLSEDSFQSLTKEQIHQFEQKFHQPEAFVKMGKGIISVPIPDDVVKQTKKPEHEAKEKQNRPDHDGR